MDGPPVSDRLHGLQSSQARKTADIRGIGHADPSRGQAVSLLERLHSDHKARLARIKAAAHRREIAEEKPMLVYQEPPAIVALDPTEPTPVPEHSEPVPWRKELISTIMRIKLAVLDDYPGVTLTDIDSRRRESTVVRARHIAMYLIKNKTLKSLPEIGRRFGGRDHTTVLHGIKKVERMIKSDDAFAAHVDSIRQRIEGHEHA
jgi:hypothetical protein